MPSYTPVSPDCHFYSLNSDLAPRLMHSITVHAIKKTYHGRNLDKGPCHIGQFLKKQSILQLVDFVFSMFQDAGLLYKSLPHPIRYYTVEHGDFNHFDFLWAIDVKTLVNEKVLHLLKYNADVTIENNKITDNVAQSWQGLRKDWQ